MDWSQILTEIAAATGQPPDQVPRPGTHEFFALMSQLEASHPELAARVQIALAEALHAEPLGVSRKSPARDGGHAFGSVS